MQKKISSTKKKAAEGAAALSVAGLSDIRRSREKASRFAVLGMLTMGCKSGYDIKKTIAMSTSNFWSESYGNIYPVLKRLLEEGAIKAEKSAVTAGGRQKQLYSITARGRQMLERWLSQPVAPQPEDNELLLKLFFGAVASPQVSRSLLRAHREEHLRQLEKFAEIEKQITQEQGTKAQKTYWLATLRCGEAISRALIQWCEATDRELQKLEG